MATNEPRLVKVSQDVMGNLYVKRRPSKITDESELLQNLTTNSIAHHWLHQGDNHQVLTGTSSATESPYSTRATNGPKVPPEDKGNLGVKRRSLKNVEKPELPPYLTTHAITHRLLEPGDNIQVKRGTSASTESLYSARATSAPKVSVENMDKLCITKRLSKIAEKPELLPNLTAHSITHSLLQPGDNIQVQRGTSASAKSLYSARATSGPKIERAFDNEPPDIAPEHFKKFSSDYLQYLQNSEIEKFAKDVKCVPLFRDTNLDKHLLVEMEEQKLKKDFQRMHASRMKLPAYKKRKEILDLIEKNQVLVLVGETGCGKTMQVPQYILDFYIRSGKGSLCTIVCTQPRRISAIGVAARVAAERCIPCGEEGSVGYQIRLESKRPRIRGSILFCTTGILINRLQSNPDLSEISHVIVDEVHERDLISDFLLMCLKDIIKINKSLKVILMSATVNSEEISTYFGNCSRIEIPGHTFPVKSYYLEDMLKFTNYKQKSKNHKLKSENQLTDPVDEQEKELYFERISQGYSHRVVNVLRNWDEERLDLDLIVAMLKNICFDRNEKTRGTILVFLPGWQEIMALLRLLLLDFYENEFLIIPLHSQSGNHYEKQALNRAPDGIRKIILATNMAETSITIDDCTVVIDSGKFKQVSFDPTNNMHILQPQWVAMSNVKQRKGRAGRTQPGESYHMFTTLKETFLQPYQVPEMQRCSLEQLILQIKIIKQCNIFPYFETALSPPKPEAVERSLKTLHKLNAIDDYETLTPLGYLLARLPVDVHLGKMLLYGAIFSCLDPILSIVACLSFKDPFIVPVWLQNQAKDKKLELADGDQSDHLLFVNVMERWSEVEDDYEESEEFCRKYFLSAQILKMLVELKMQYTSYLKQLNFLNDIDASCLDYNVNSGNDLLIKSIICAALYPNIAQVQPRKSNNSGRLPLIAKGIDGNNLYVHPKSINSFATTIETGWFVYHKKMKSTQVYVHDTADVNPMCLLLFGNQVIEEHPGTLVVDDCLKFYLPAKIKYILHLKKKLDSVLERKFSNPSDTKWQHEYKGISTLKKVVKYIAKI